MNKIKNQFFGLDKEQWNYFKNSIDSNSQEFTDFQEKLRRFVSYYNRNLYKVARKRFKKNLTFQLENILEILIKKTDKTKFNDHLLLNFSIDTSLLNASLYCLEALEKVNSQKINEFSKKVLKYKRELYTLLKEEYERENINEKFCTNDLFSSLNIDEDCKSSDINNQAVTILSPSRFSLYSLTVIALCYKFNIPIKSIIIKKFSLRRFNNEFKRDGFKLFRKIYRKLILKSDENADKISISFKELSNKLTGGFSDVTKLAKERKIPFLFVDEFENSTNYLLKNKTNIALFTGGGIIGKKFLEMFKFGIVNIHMGLLPCYKGMDVVESPLSEGRYDCVGLTSHIMEKTIDTGPMISSYKISPFEYKTIGALRNEIALIMPFILIDSYFNFFQNNQTFKSQVDLGRQYYFLHDDLKKIVNKVLFYNYKFSGNTRINNFINSIMNNKKLKFK